MNKEKAILTMAIVRHGQSEGNLSNVWHGARSDVGLTALGIKQAEVTANYLAQTMPDTKRVFSSPLRRAKQTANIIAVALGAKVQVLDGLIEIDWGDLEGLTTAEVAEQYPDVIRLWGTHLSSALPGGDAASDVGERSAATINKIANLHAGDRQVVLVSHQGAITLGLGVLLNKSTGMLDYQPSNCGIMIVEFSPTPKLIVQDYTKHLQAAGLETGKWGM